MVSSKRNSTNSVMSLISHVKNLSEKAGIILEELTTAGKQLSKTKRVYENHQIQQLNDDPVFVDIVDFIIKNIKEDCIVTESARNNYNLLLNTGILDMALEAFDIDCCTDDESALYQEMDISELKSIINKKKSEIQKCKYEYDNIRKQNDILEKHCTEMDNEMPYIDTLISKLLVAETTDDFSGKERQFVEFKSNLDKYRNEVVHTINFLLDPLKLFIKNHLSEQQSECLLKKFLNFDDKANSSLYNENTIVQSYSGIFKTHVQLNNCISRLLHFILKSYIPSFLNKYGANINNLFLHSKENIDQFDMNNEISFSNNDRDGIYSKHYKEHDNLIRAFISCLDTEVKQPFIASNNMDFNERNISECLKNYSQIYAEFTYNTLVKQAEEIGYLELINIINSQNCAFWKNHLSTLNKKSHESVSCIRGELHRYLISHIKPYIEDKMKIWNLKKNDLLLDCLEKDIQPLEPLVSYLKEINLDFTSQIECYNKTIFDKEVVLKKCTTHLDQILHILNNNIIKIISSDDMYTYKNHFSIEQTSSDMFLSMDCPSDIENKKLSMILLMISYIGTLYNVPIDTKMDVNKYQSTIEILSNHLNNSFSIHDQLINEDHTEFLELLVKLSKSLMLNNVESIDNNCLQNDPNQTVPLTPSLETVLPHDILLSFNNVNNAVNDAEKNLNENINEITSKKKVLISDQKIQKKREEILKFCLEC